MSEPHHSRESVRRGARGFAPGTPLAQLPPTAQRILSAAQRILKRDGFTGLTYQALAAESGEYKDSVRYHFGSKAGLITAIVDSTVHDASLGIYAEARHESDARRRFTRIIDGSRRLTKGDQSWTTWELLPHILRDARLHPQVAELYEWYRDHYLEMLAVGDDPEQAARARDLACIALSVLDGLALQKALDPDRVDLERIFDLWLEIVTASLDVAIPQEPDAAT